MINKEASAHTIPTQNTNNGKPVKVSTEPKNNPKNGHKQSLIDEENGARTPDQENEKSRATAPQSINGKANNATNGFKPEVTMQQLMGAQQQDPNQATFYKPKLSDTHRSAANATAGENVDLRLTDNLYKYLPFYRKFGDSPVLYETLFRNHSILKRIYDSFLEQHRLTGTQNIYLFNPYALFETSKTEAADNNMSVMGGGHSIAPDKRSRRSKNSRQEDGLRMFKTLIYRSKLLQGYAGPISLLDQMTILKEFNLAAEPIIPKEITRANPTTFDDVIKLA